MRDDNEQRAYREWRKMVAIAAKRPAENPLDIVHEPWWYQFSNFLNDMGYPPAGKGLKRHDDKRPFSPGNVFWG